MRVRVRAMERARARLRVRVRLRARVRGCRGTALVVMSVPSLQPGLP